MTIKQSIIACLICLTVGGALGYYALPSKIITKTVTVTQVVHDSQTVKHNNVQTTTTKKPDGTVVIVEEDKSVEDSKSSAETQSTQKSDKEVSYSKSTLNIGAVSVFDLRSGALSYGAYLNKQVLGPFTLGIQVTQQPSVGMMIGVNF